MGVWVKSRLFIGFLAVTAVAFVLTSCSVEQVVVVSDPYIETIYRGIWPPSSTGFALRALFSGFKVNSVTLEEQDDLFAFLESQENAIDAVVVSPWHSLAASGDNQIRFITAGGITNLSGIDSLVSVIPDRSTQMAQLGRLAGTWAGHEGLPAVLLFDGSNEAIRIEIQLLEKGYTEADENAPMMKKFDVGGEGKEIIPPDFITAASGSSIILLFAGTLNSLVMEATDEAAPPVITEYLYGSSAWSDRIVASVELNQIAMNKAIILELRNSSPDKTRYYPSRVNKGHLYRLIRKNGLTLLSSQTYNSARR